MSTGRVRKPPTLAELAKELGVSASTVSRAFTAPRLLRPETVDRIRARALDRGYVPNAHARALSTGLPRTIGLVVPDIANPYFPPMLRAAQRAAEKSDHTVIVADTDGDPERELTMIARLSTQAESLLIASPRGPAATLLPVAEHQRVLFINRDEPGTCRILVSARRAVQQGMESLLQQGHRRFAYVGGPARSWAEEERRSAVDGFAGQTGVSLEHFRIESGTYADALAAGDALSRFAPTAVIAFDDVIAHGIIDALTMRGIEVPRQVSVLGCDDTQAIATQPPLSTIALRVAEAAEQAVAIVTAGSPNELLTERRIELDGELVLRQSLAPAP